MKRTVAILLVACAGVAVGSYSGTAVSAPAPKAVAKPQPVRWEYGRLQLRTAPGWTSAAENLAADSDADLAKKLKADLPADAGEHAASLAILNRLGDQGWEMVTHVKMGTYDFYRFKRQVQPKE